MTEPYSPEGRLLARYPETVALTPARRASLKLVAFGLALVAAAMALVVLPQGASMASGIYHAAGWIGLALFGPATTYLAYRAARPRVALRLDADGFTDESSLTAVGFVPWGEVVGVGTSQISRATMVGVQLRDPAAFIAKLTWFRRIAARTNLRMFGEPVWINPAGLPDADELAALIEVYRRSWEGRPQHMLVEREPVWPFTDTPRRAVRRSA